MDYEKEYKAALERASVIYTGKYKPEIAAFCKETLEAVFPELEDYSDMRIIKEITFFLKQKGGYNKEWIDWLEKLAPKPQGKSDEAIKEEKVDNANKIKPKFRVGDWVTDGNSVFHITNMDYGCYQFEDGYDFIDSIDAKCHLWTVEDAKDGDVLVASDGSIFVFACTDDCYCKHYVALATNGVIVVNKGLKQNWEDSCGVHPATKEQRELLFSKMGERGYQWDADNKRLIYLL